MGELETSSAAIPPTRILVVDDEATIRSVIRQVLEDDGHTVVEAACAEDALELFQAEPFPLVMTDIYMGKMNGLQLLDAVKSIHHDVLVVVMTSNACLDTATQALRSGAYDYLMKPFDDIDLISAVIGRAAERLGLLQQNHDLIAELRSKTRDLQEVNRQLREMADRDGLTGLYNHRYFCNALDHELARVSGCPTEFSLIFLDIDHFKHYNDTNGHLAGDGLLEALAGILDKHCPESGICTRYGGEEFVMLLPDHSKERAHLLAQTVRSAIESHPFEHAETQPLGRVTVSMGVASYPSDGADSRMLIDHADQALYQAKYGGRNSVCCWSGGDSGTTMLADRRS